MAHVELIQEDLTSGRLVAAYPLVVRTSESYRLVGREADSNRPEVVAFRDWLLAEVESGRTRIRPATMLSVA
jgi:LysR family glycine cleavage system transcriptional activator